MEGVRFFYLKLTQSNWKCRSQFGLLEEHGKQEKMLMSQITGVLEVQTVNADVVIHQHCFTLIS
jgi:hypothetical protein